MRILKKPSSADGGTLLKVLLGTSFILLLTGILAATAGIAALSIYLQKYEARAASFDLDEVSRMEAASLLLDRNGTEFGKLFIQNRNPVPLNRISRHLIHAVIAAEDNRFYQHRGVDWWGVARAAIENYRQRRIAQGASTITQQLARNTYEMRERTMERKLVEMFLAKRIEERYTKDQILEFYLNRVYFGSGFYGAEAAARGYFGKAAAELTPDESAMLAGLLRSPQTLSPWNNPTGAQNIRNVVLQQMRDLGFLSRAELEAALARETPVQPRSNPHRVSYIHDLIRQQAIQALGFERAMNGGYRIRTTLDMRLQRAAEDALRQQLDAIEKHPEFRHPTYASYRQEHAEIERRIDRGDPAARMPPPEYLQGALLVLENTTGGVLALVGGRDFRHSEFNRVTQARRPAGTVFTPIVFAAACENGLSPATVVDDSALDNRFVMVGGATGILGEWGVERVENAYEGPMTSRMALVKGKNAALVRLGFQLGLEKLRQTVQALGIRSPLREYSNAFLGSSEMTLEELTLAFTTFAGQGRRPATTYLIEAIEEADGRVIYRAPRQQVRGLSGAAAFQTHTALEQILTEGVEHLAHRRDGLRDIPAAGKNGTAYGFTDTYFIGYTSAVTAGVWIGFDKPTRIYRGAFGRDLAMPVWVRVMNMASELLPPAPFRRSLEVEPVEVCSTTGLLASPKCTIQTADGRTQRTTYIEFLTPSQKPTEVCPGHDAPPVRAIAKEYNQEDWPRAAPAIDLSLIRPIAISEPALVGFNDVYRALQPASQVAARGVQVARALPVQFADGTTADAGNLGQTAEGISVATAIPIQAPGEREVRRAQTAAGFRPIERPALELAPPPPSQF